MTTSKTGNRPRDTSLPRAEADQESASTPASAAESATGSTGEATPADKYVSGGLRGAGWEETLIPHMWGNARFGSYDAPGTGGFFTRARSLFADASPAQRQQILGERLGSRSLTPARSPKLHELLGQLNERSVPGLHFTFEHIDSLSRQDPSMVEPVARALSNFLETDSSDEAFDLAHALLRDVAYPSQIGQGSKGTCAATAIQCLFALTQPARYVSTVTELHREAPVSLPGGDVLHPRNDWREDSRDSRSLSERVFQNAVMNFGMVFFSYDSPEDDGASEPGLSHTAIDRILEQLQPFGPAAKHNADYWPTRRMKMRSLEDDLVRGRPVILEFPGHAVTALAISWSNGQREVHINSDGVEYRVPYDVLTQLIRAVHTVDDPGLDNLRLEEI